MMRRRVRVFHAAPIGSPGRSVSFRNAPATLRAPWKRVREVRLEVTRGCRGGGRPHSSGIMNVPLFRSTSGLCGRGSDSANRGSVSRRPESTFGSLPQQETPVRNSPRPMARALALVGDSA